MKMKRCSKCKTEKKVTEFFANKKSRAKDGLQNICKPCNKITTREWEARHPNRVRSSTREAELKKKFGITVAMYDEMLKKQDGRCAICGGYNTNKKRLSVDHHHGTGEVRGLLCNNCNVGLGFLKDNPIVLQNAIDYLMRSVRIPA